MLTQRSKPALRRPSVPPLCFFLSPVLTPTWTFLDACHSQATRCIMMIDDAFICAHGARLRRRACAVLCVKRVCVARCALDAPGRVHCTRRTRIRGIRAIPNMAKSIIVSDIY